MSEQTELLIEKVRKYTYLFDTSHEYYKNVVKKAETWNEIAAELNIKSDAAKLKWKNLRDSYMRHKRFTKGQAGQAKKYGKWPWSSHMTIFDDTLQFRPQSSNITQSSIEIEATRLPTPVTPPLTENNESDQLSSSPSKMPPPAPPKRTKLKSQCKARGNISSNSEVDKVIDFLQSKHSQEQQLDRVDHLFLSYAETFKTFRPTTQAMMKLQLATLFSQTELNELREQEVSPATSPALSNNSLSSSGFESQSYTSPTYYPEVKGDDSWG